MQSDRAMETRPDALQILPRTDAFEARCLYGSSEIYPCHSCIFNAISWNRPAALKLFLDRGAQPNGLIEHLFATDREVWQDLKHDTWLTIAVELGRTACVGILL